MPKDRITSITRPKIDINKLLYFEKVTETEQYDGLQWYKNPELREVERLTPESQGYFREFSTSVVIKRKAVSESDLKEHVGFFHQKLLIKIDLVNYGHDYDYAWFYRASHGITIKNFDLVFGCTQPIALNDQRFCHAIGKPKRITEEQAKKLLFTHEAIALVDEVPDPENPSKQIWRINV